MRFDRSTTVAVAVLVGIASILSLDVLGTRSTIASWFAVADLAGGSTAAVAETAHERAATVRELEAALDADPTLSLMLLATGLGIGLIGGSTVAYLHQRRRVRRGERDA